MGEFIVAQRVEDVNLKEEEWVKRFNWERKNGNQRIGIMLM